MTQDELEVETVVKLWEDKKDYEAIFRKYITIGDDGEEHYDVIDMEREAQRAVRRITDHQEIVITEVWHMAHFWVSYGRCTMPGSPMGWSEKLSRHWAG